MTQEYQSQSEINIQVNKLEYIALLVRLLELDETEENRTWYKRQLNKYS